MAKTKLFKKIFFPSVFLCSANSPENLSFLQQGRHRLHRELAGCLLSP